MPGTQTEVLDVLVVGAGPAGLAAAVAADRDPGCRVGLIDAGGRPGGQYWRQPADASTPSRSASHVVAGRRYDDLAADLRPLTERGDYFPHHHVWGITGSAGDFVVQATDRRRPQERQVRLRARRLVLAPGAYDRQIPFPGWDLPGVVAVGGAQSLLKEHGVVLPGQRTVVAGTGPLLLSVAASLAQAGVRVHSIHEAAALRGWLRSPGALVGAGDKLVEGGALAATLVRHGVRVRTRSMVTQAHGTDRLEAVTVTRVSADGTPVGGRSRRIRTDVLAVGWGFTPQLELVVQLGCRTRVDVDGSAVAVVDRDQLSTVPGVWIAGEACGVAGSAVAVLEGFAAGAMASGQRDGLDPRDARRLRRLRRFADALHRAHPEPAGWWRSLTPDTVICRCEEVTWEQLSASCTVYDIGDARTAKLLSRVGMGWCQGRVCGYACEVLTARNVGRRPDPTSTTKRPLADPVLLADLTQLLEEKP